MTRHLPQLMPECNAPGQQFCGLCRDRDSGRAFRDTILQIRGIEGVYTDFTCPKDRHWKSRGLGDTIAKITDALHIPKCGGCKKRQAKLNKLAPYKDTP